jgi:hypothetical protein
VYYPSWFNELQKSIGKTQLDMNNKIGGLSDSILAGGKAPQGGVWNGGATQYQGAAPAQPNPVPNPNYAGNGMNTGGLG